MNITKENAKLVSAQLTEKIKENVSTKKDLFEFALVEAIYSTIPKAVLDFGNTHPSYIKKVSNITVEGNGFNYINFSLKTSIIKSNTGFSPSVKQAEVLSKLRNDWDNSDKEYRKLREEIQNSLITLRTYNRIKQAFPEAYSLLPNDGVTAISVCVDDIRGKLSSALS